MIKKKKEVLRKKGQAWLAYRQDIAWKNEFSFKKKTSHKAGIEPTTRGISVYEKYEMHVNRCTT